MSTSLHVGKKRDVTITTSDGSTLAPGALGVVSQNPAILAVAVNPTTNLVTVTALAPFSSVNVTYSATGYQPLTEVYTVSPMPTLVAVDGPEY